MAAVPLVYARDRLGDFPADTARVSSESSREPGAYHTRSVQTYANSTVRRALVGDMDICLPVSAVVHPFLSKEY